MSILTPVMVTATGTVVNTAARISGFTFTNKSTSPADVVFSSLNASGTVGAVKFEVPTVGSSSVTHTYGGGYGIKFSSGVFVSVPTSVVGFITYM